VLEQPLRFLQMLRAQKVVEHEDILESKRTRRRRRRKRRTLGGVFSTVKSFDY
jgi:hypothetical protein